MKRFVEILQYRAMTLKELRTVCEYDFSQCAGKYLYITFVEANLICLQQWLPALVLGTHRTLLNSYKTRLLLALTWHCGCKLLHA